MKKISSLAVTSFVVGLVWLATAPGVQAAPTFVNGDFEAGISTGWDSITPINTPGWVANHTGTGSTFFPALNRNQSCGGPYGNGNQLCQFVTLGGTEDGGTSSLEQTVSGFIRGGSYTVSWIQSSEFTASDVVDLAIIGASGTLSASFTSAPYPGGAQFWYGWQTMTETFLASDPLLTFRFNSRASNFEAGIDAVGLGEATVVPEPSTIALFMVAILGLICTRKNGRKSF